MSAVSVVACASCAAVQPGIPAGTTPDADALAVDAAPTDDTPAAQDRRISGADGAAAAKDRFVFTPVPCKNPQEIVCEDFEQGRMNPLWWTNGQRARMTVDGTRPRGGQYALHVKAGKSADGVWVNIQNIFPLPKNNTFFLRAFVYVAPPPPLFNYTLFSVTGKRPSGEQAGAGVESVTDPWGDPKAPRVAQLSGPGHSGLNGKLPVSFGVWACWEWQVQSGTNEWRVWIDGVEQVMLSPKIQPTGGWEVPDLDTLTIGVQQHDEPASIEVWFDDLVVAKDRVGCGSK